MSFKRALEDSAETAAKKQKRGFQVGPANLPDGTWKRKNQRIKRDLIERAQIKKSYAKLRERSATEPSVTTHDSKKTPQHPMQEAASLELHPARQELLDAADTAEDKAGGFQEPSRRSGQHERPGKRKPFEREMRVADEKKIAAEAREKAREKARREREEKMEERERHRRVMAKARTGGKNGQRKLGRESKVLLDKVKRLMGSG